MSRVEARVLAHDFVRLSRDRAQVLLAEFGFDLDRKIELLRDDPRGLAGPEVGTRDHLARMKTGLDLERRFARLPAAELGNRRVGRTREMAQAIALALTVANQN